jgi:hypothetical protein
MNRKAWWSAFLLIGLSSLVGCGTAADNSAGSDDDEEIRADPLAMPTEIRSFLSAQDWGNHHLEWHTVRQWDLLGASDQAWAKKQGWSRADVQEGAKGNGLEFLAMHRVMIRTLVQTYPRDASLFDGWTAPPTDPKDKADPCKGGAFDPSKLPALDKLANDLGDFTSDDDIGLYIETGLRPTASDPSARSKDASTGIHNYIHNRFSDPKSKIDIGDPSVNLQNKRFWRLHGWIESRWTEFRKMKGLTEDDPAYAAAIKKAEDMLTLKVKGGLGGPAPEPPPDSLRKFFERDGT